MPDPKVPDLKRNDKVYCTVEQKAEALGQRFYPLINANLDDINMEKLFDEDYSAEQGQTASTEE